MKDIKTKIERGADKDNFLILSYDSNEANLDELYNFFCMIKDTAKEYSVIALPQIMDLKYCNKEQLSKLLDLYETSVNIIKGVLHE